MKTSTDNRCSGSRRGDGKKGRPVAASRFKRIVNAVKSAVNWFQVDGANHIARGLLAARDGHSRTASLSYDDGSCLVGISVPLGRIPTITNSQLVCLMRLQKQARIARLDHDPEDGALVLRGSSICGKRENPAFTVRHLLADVQRILSDDRLEVLLGH